MTLCLDLKIEEQKEKLDIMHHDLIFNHNSKIHLKAQIKLCAPLNLLAKTPLNNEKHLWAQSLPYCLFRLWARLTYPFANDQASQVGEAGH